MNLEVCHSPTIRRPCPSQLIDSCRDLAVLLVGHGTRKSSGQDQFRDLYQKFALSMQPITCELAFLELAEPDITEAIQRLTANPCIQRLLVVPALLFTAGHALEDIPTAVREALGGTPMELIGQTPALECSQGVLQLSAIRFRQAVCPAACLDACSGLVCRKATWVLVGRGSSSQSAAEKMRGFCNLRQSWTQVRQAITAFIYGQSPTVAEALEMASRSNSEIVVVQPHLLFSGLLMDELSQQVAEFGLRNPHQRWHLAQPLGADQLLADLLANMACDHLTAAANWEA